MHVGEQKIIFVQIQNYIFILSVKGVFSTNYVILKKCLQGKNDYSVFWMNMRYLMVCILIFFFFISAISSVPTPFPSLPMFDSLSSLYVYINNKCLNHAVFRTCTRNFSLFIIALVKSCRKNGGGGGIPPVNPSTPIRKYVDPPLKRRKDNSCLELSNSQIIRSHWHCF